MNAFHIKMKQVRELKNCLNLQLLINEAYKILGNPVILYDADWKILAYAEGVITDDPLWNNHINDGAIEGNVETYLNAGFIDLLISKDKVLIMESEQLKYSRIFGKIFDKDGNLMAGVSIVASDKPFEEGDLVLTEAICKILSDEILKIPYYQGFAQMKLESCINMLISKELRDLNDRLYVSLFVEMVYRGLKNNLYLAVADISQRDPTYTKLEYYRDLFKRIRPAFKYSIYANYIVIIMSTDEISFHPKKALARLNRFFEQDHIRVGISNRFENLFDLRKYFNEAVYALNYGLGINSNRSISPYDECSHAVQE